MDLMNLQELCEEAIADVDGCLGCALVDLDTGLPLASKVVAGSLLQQGAMELLAAASVDYFRGHMVWQLELAMSAGESAGRFVQDIQTTTEDTYNFMSIVPGRESTLLLLVLDKAANLGLGWISMRQVLARLGGTENDSTDKGTDAQPQDLAVVKPSAFPPAAREQGANVAPARSASTRTSHVPYRDVASDDDRSGEDHVGRQWRGGRGGRRQVR